MKVDKPNESSRAELSSMTERQIALKIQSIPIGDDGYLFDDTDRMVVASTVIYAGTHPNDAPGSTYYAVLIGGSFHRIDLDTFIVESKPSYNLSDDEHMQTIPHVFVDPMFH